MAVYRPTYRDPKTGKQKQSATWWYGFTFAGQRIQESAKTTRKTIATEAEKNRRKELEKAYAGIPSEKPEHRIRTVSVALAEYENSYAPNHRPKAVAWVKERTAHVNRLLGNLLIPRPERIEDGRVHDRPAPRTRHGCRRGQEKAHCDRQ